jgi:hypothetical protein
MTRKRVRVAVAGVALTLAAVGASVVAQASVPDAATGTITACRNGEHAVRIIDTATSSCSSGETQLDWLARGGRTYENRANAAQTITGGLNIASVTVPAGKYAVAGKVNAHDLSGVVNFVQCGFSTISENGRSTLIAGGWATTQAQATATFAVSTTVALFCNPSAAAEVTMATLVATEVSAIN